MPAKRYAGINTKKYKRSGGSLPKLGGSAHFVLEKIAEKVLIFSLVRRQDARNYRVNESKVELLTQYNGGLTKLKNEPIVFILLLGSCRSQECGHERLVKCGRPLERINSDYLSFAVKKEELQQLCPQEFEWFKMMMFERNLETCIETTKYAGNYRDFEAGMRCIQTYTFDCMQEKQREHFNSLYAGTNKVVMELCQDGPYQDDLLDDNYLTTIFQRPNSVYITSRYNLLDILEITVEQKVILAGITQKIGPLQLTPEHEAVCVTKKTGNVSLVCNACDILHVISVHVRLKRDVVDKFDKEFVPYFQLAILLAFEMQVNPSFDTSPFPYRCLIHHHRERINGIVMHFHSTLLSTAAETRGNVQSATPGKLITRRRIGIVYGNNTEDKETSLHAYGRISTTRAVHAEGAARVRALLQKVPENHPEDRNEKSHGKRIPRAAVLIAEAQESNGFKEFLECSHHTIRRQCGDDTAQFAKEFLDRMSSSLLRVHCAPYTEEVCSIKSGASVYRMQALALVVLAVLASLFKVEKRIFLFKIKIRNIVINLPLLEDSNGSRMVDRCVERRTMVSVQILHYYTRRIVQHQMCTFVVMISKKGEKRRKSELLARFKCECKGLSFEGTVYRGTDRNYKRNITSSHDVEIIINTLSAGDSRTQKCTYDWQAAVKILHRLRCCSVLRDVIKLKLIDIRNRNWSTRITCEYWTNLMKITNIVFDGILNNFGLADCKLLIQLDISVAETTCSNVTLRSGQVYQFRAIFDPDFLKLVKDQRSINAIFFSIVLFFDVGGEKQLLEMGEK
ncbi:hypothetical protein WN51_09859 [Melipona quadrifasciata]|uniref:Uncharacterized protein n=1 Tax=Melipona quadrifasciata TaxID=166423 RepID=A0A0M9A5A9_9HYME|nr:hypothetical protein WN51_09859 [Melipona quadrifasciata]